jgi:Tol biopolymer transport system component
MQRSRARSPVLLRATWAAVLVVSFLIVLGAASAGSSGAASAGRAIGATRVVQPRTLLAIRYPIKAFAQDGGRIAWIGRGQGRGRHAGCALHVRALSSGRTAVTPLSHASCERNYLWRSGALALAGRTAAWVEDSSCSISSCWWSVVRAVAGAERARVVASADLSCGWSCDGHQPQPLLAGAGGLLTYSYDTLGRVRRIVAGGVRPLFATSGIVQGLAVAGGRAAAVSLTLAGGSGRLDAPTWSPDGTKLAVAHGVFLAFASRQVPVAVMNADGTGLRDLPSSYTCVGGSQAPSFAWSPDGQKIAYNDCGPKIRVVNADGSGDRPLTEGTAPAWSPDGTTMAFERNSLDRSKPAIYLMNADGSNIRELANLATGSQHYLGPLAWSPDGTRIAFSFDGSLEVLNADGSDPHQLGSAKGDEPTWSPDSSEIAFRATAGGLFVIGANGTDLRRLTTGPDAHPSWSPDGKTIVFAHGAFTTIYTQELMDLYAVDPDGGNLRPFAVPPVKVESTAKVRSSNLRTTFAAAGTPAGLALAGKLVAVGSVAAGIDRITLFKAATGARLSIVELGADHGDFAVVGADAHWIVFHLGAEISALNIHSRKVIALARAATSRSGCASLSRCFSVSGRRVAWAENITGHGRIRSLQLPS